jgi:transposase, IS605 orfB family
MPQFTYRTNLTHALLDENKQQLLDFMQEQGRYFRTVFNRFYFLELSSKDKLTLWKEYCSSQFLQEKGYPFGTKYANSLFQEAYNKAVLHQEEYCFRIQQIEDRIKVLTLKKEKLVDKLAKTFKSVNKLDKKDTRFKTLRFNLLKEARAIKTSIYWVNRKLEKQESLLKSSSLRSVTFGGKDFQRKLSRKQITGMKWQSLRNKFIYAIGKSERKCGNDSIQFDVKNKTLKIELDRGKDYKNYLCLENIENQYDSPFFKENNLLAEVHKKTQRIILTKFSSNIAKCKFELHTTVEKEESLALQEIQAKIRAFSDNLNEPNQDEAKKTIKDYVKTLYQEKRGEACLGIDFNYQHLDISSNLVNNQLQNTEQENQEYYDFEQTIHYAISQHNRYQNKENLRQAIKTVVSLAKQHNLNIKIEDLNFNRKKAKLFSAYSEYNKVYNRMLSSLPYSTYEKMMEIECDKAGVYLIKVNPKNTSQKAIENGWERHIGAARIIAQQI